MLLIHESIITCTKAHTHVYHEQLYSLTVSLEKRRNGIRDPKRMTLCDGTRDDSRECMGLGTRTGRGRLRAVLGLAALHTDWGLMVQASKRLRW